MRKAKKNASENYECLKKWPNEGHLQCGDSEENNHFFEAFVLNTFIRGEGKTINNAEENAFNQYLKIINCKHHDFEEIVISGNIINRYGKCKHCNYNSKKAFPPKNSCNICGKKNVGLSFDIVNFQNGELNYYCLHHFLEKTTNINNEKWFNENIKEEMRKQNIIISEKDLFSENVSNSYLIYLKYNHIRNIIKRETILLYKFLFNEDVMKVKFKNEFELSDEIEDFIKNNSKNIKRKIMEKIDLIIKNNNVKMPFFEQLSLGMKNADLEINLYRIKFIKENINKNMEKYAYKALGLNFNNIEDDMVDLETKINKLISKKIAS